MNENKGIIIDPYCGSGTTLLAAKLLGHDFIGIDISQEYIELANSRLDKCLLEEKAVREECNKHFVSKTFQQRKENGEKTGKFKTGGYALFEEKKPDIQTSIFDK
jgi:site-specific DNA-methyltransferase (adenine-specific)